jgi:hypothetical protein
MLVLNQCVDWMMHCKGWVMCTSLDPPSTKSTWMQEGTVRKSNQDKGDMCHNPTRKKIQKLEQLQNKGIEHTFSLVR